MPWLRITGPPFKTQRVVEPKKVEDREREGKYEVPGEVTWNQARGWSSNLTPLAEMVC